MKSVLSAILAVAALLLIFAAGFWTGREYARQEENNRRIRESAAEILESLKKINKDLKEEREFIRDLSGGVQVDKPASPY